VRKPRISTPPVKSTASNAGPRPASPPSLAPSDPLVAVLTPLYNGEEFLVETLECVQGQTYPNVVHVIVDNGSTDASPEILARYANARTPVIVHRFEETVPVAQNYQRTLDHLPEGAKYFRYLAADDTMPADSIEKMVALAESEADIHIVGSMCSRGENTADAGYENRGLPVDRQVFDGDWIAKTYLQGLHSCMRLGHTLFRTEVARRRRPFFTPDTMGSDVAAILDVCHGVKFGFVHEDLGFMRDHKGALSNTAAKELKTEMTEWLDWIDEFGPRYMTPREYEYRVWWQLQMYYRSLLRWRFIDRRGDIADTHYKRLASEGRAPNLLDYALALVAFPLAIVPRYARRLRDRIAPNRQLPPVRGNAFEGATISAPPSEETA
jgi:glycosyltransferase involved in cell wall biosynthesis